MAEEALSCGAFVDIGVPIVGQDATVRYDVGHYVKILQHLVNKRNSKSKKATSVWQVTEV